MRNLLLSKKLKRSEIRILVVDDNQTRYNQILEIFRSKNHIVEAILLDDLTTFEKQLNTSWDLIFFGRAYDIKIEQAIALIQTTSQKNVPVLLLTPEDYVADQYALYAQKGIYDVLNLDYYERFYINVVRALSYSRALQNQANLLNDLENAKLQTQVLVEDQNKAIATIQEGIHTDANEEYLALFGIQSLEDLIGFPLLDIIQPKKVADFKSRFKKVSQGQFEFGRFEIDTANAEAKSKNPLRVEFIPAEEADSIQITIETQSPSEDSEASTDESPTNQNILQNVQRFLKNQPAQYNAMVIFSLANCPESIFNANWDTFKYYFEKLSDFIKAQTHGRVFEISTSIYATIIQAESKEILESKLAGLSVLEKPQLVSIGSNNYKQQVKLGYCIFDAEQLNESNFKQLIEDTYNTRLSQNSSASDLDLMATLDETEITLSPLNKQEALESQQTFEPVISLSTPSPSDKIEMSLSPSADQTSDENKASNSQSSEPEIVLNRSTKPVSLVSENEAIQQPSVSNESSLLSQLQKALDNSEIQVKYQQLYDKQDTNLHTYEVSGGFIYNDELKKISNLVELNNDPELSIKIDRWILVEASKQLHNFITQYPEAKLIVNLNRHSLLQDQQLPALVAKLLTIIGSSQDHPLILQFEEEDLAKNLADSAKSVAVLREHGAEISIRGFGSTISSEAILKGSDISLVTLDENTTAMLSKDDTLQELQQKIESYIAIKPVELLLKNLDDISSFANAWNVETRFLQGDYFQKKLDHLTDVQDQ